MATTTIRAAGTSVVGITVHLRRGAAGHAVQKTPWMAVIKDAATGAPPTDTAPTTPLTIATALPTALPTARLTATGPPTALVTTPPTDATVSPQTHTAGMPPQIDRGAGAMRSPLGLRPY